MLATLGTSSFVRQAQACTHGSARRSAAAAVALVTSTCVRSFHILIIPLVSRQASLLLAVSNEARALRHVVGTNIATIVAAEGLSAW